MRRLWIWKALLWLSSLLSYIAWAIELPRINSSGVLLIATVIFKNASSISRHGESTLILSLFFHYLFILSILKMCSWFQIWMFSFVTSKSAQTNGLWSPFIAQVNTYRLWSRHLLQYQLLESALSFNAGCISQKSDPFFALLWAASKLKKSLN